MRVLRSALVAACEAIGCPTAMKWNKPKTLSRLADLCEQMGDEPAAPDDEGAAAVVAAVHAEWKAGRLDQLQVVDDVGKPEVAKAFVEEHGGPFSAAVEEAEASEGDGEPTAEPETKKVAEAEADPEAKPAKARKAKKAAEAEAKAEDETEPVKPAAKKDGKPPAEKKGEFVGCLDAALYVVRDMKKPATIDDLAAAAVAYQGKHGGKENAKQMAFDIKRAIRAAEVFGLVERDGKTIKPAGN